MARRRSGSSAACAASLTRGAARLGFACAPKLRFVAWLSPSAFAAARHAKQGLRPTARGAATRFAPAARGVARGTGGGHTALMPTMEEIEAQLVGPGGMFEVGEEMVLGERMQVFKQRVPSLRTFVERSAGFGDAEYIIFGERRITFAQHARAVASVARALRERFGVKQGDRVAILAANCPEWIVAFWATVSLGAIAVGLNGWWTADEILYGVGDCRAEASDRRPEAARAPRRRVAGRAGGRDRVAVRRALEPRPDAPLPDAPIAEDDPAIILYTSGTTGRPKGAVQSHRNVIALIAITMYSRAAQPACWRRRRRRTRRPHPRPASSSPTRSSTSRGCTPPRSPASRRERARCGTSVASIPAVAMALIEREQVHQLGCDGHGRVPHDQPPRVRPVRPLDAAPDRRRRRADRTRAAAPHARRLPVDQARPARPRLRQHRVHRARDHHRRRGVGAPSDVGRARRCRPSRSRSATPKGARCPRARRARSASAARW